jgi:hypothetical protein
MRSVTPAEVTENLPMLELLFRTRFRWRLRPRSVTGDAAYGTVENVAAVEKAGIRAYVALPKHDERSPLFGKNEFVYDAEKDIYICPQGETLHRQGLDYKEEIRQVRCQALCLQSVSPQEPLHEEQAEETLAQAQFRGGVPRKGARLPRH